jgi:thioredoxin 1
MFQRIGMRDSRGAQVLRQQLAHDGVRRQDGDCMSPREALEQLGLEPFGCQFRTLQAVCRASQARDLALRDAKGAPRGAQRPQQVALDRIGLNEGAPEVRADDRTSPLAKPATPKQQHDVCTPAVLQRQATGRNAGPRITVQRERPEVIRAAHMLIFSRSAGAGDIDRLKSGSVDTISWVMWFEHGPGGAMMRQHPRSSALNIRRPAMSDDIVHVTDASFEEEVLKSTLPVLVDYWAEWCGPCKMIAPVLDEIARDYAGKIKVCKLDVDANPETPSRYSIRGIPTLMIFVNGAAEATKVGAVSKTQLSAFIDSAIA